VKEDYREDIAFIGAHCLSSYVPRSFSGDRQNGGRAEHSRGFRWKFAWLGPHGLPLSRPRLFQTLMPLSTLDSRETVRGSRPLTATGRDRTKYRESIFYNKEPKSPEKEEEK
jgi:hypothetical protein